MSGAASSMGAASAGSSASMPGGASAAIPQVSAKGGDELPYMTAAEVDALQALLRRAKHTGQVSEQARVSGLVVTEEQRAMVEAGKIMTFPDQQFAWVPEVRAKAKAKMAPPVPAMKYVGEDHGGAMTDASKRRFLDDVVDEDASFAEFEVVQAINDFNGGFSAAAPPPGMPFGMWYWAIWVDMLAPGNAGLGPIALGEEDGVPLVSSTTQMATGALATSQMASTTMTAGMAVLPGNAPLPPTTKTLHGTLRSMKRSKTP